jgi:hypothetical protein
MQPTARSRASAVCLLLINLMLINLSTAPSWAQQPPKLEIVIVEGEGAINNVKERVNREPIVQVQDDNHKPVAGAAVVFFLPNQGPGGSFSDGTRSLTVTTDAQGRAVARGIRYNGASGQMQIRVTATANGQTATATITQTNVAGSGSGAGGLSTTAKVLIIVGVAAGAAVGAVVATRGGSSSSSSNPSGGIPTSISAGTPTVGAP